MTALIDSWSFSCLSSWSAILINWDRRAPWYKDHGSIRTFWCSNKQSIVKISPECNRPTVKIRAWRSPAKGSNPERISRYLILSWLTWRRPRIWWARPTSKLPHKCRRKDLNRKREALQKQQYSNQYKSSQKVKSKWASHWLRKRGQSNATTMSSNQSSKQRISHRSPTISRDYPVVSTGFKWWIARQASQGLAQASQRKRKRDLALQRREKVLLEQRNDQSP